MAAPRTHCSDEVHCIAFWNNVVLVDIEGEIDLPRMRRVGDAYRQLLANYPRIAVLTVLRPAVPVAGPDARAENMRFTRELGDCISRTVIVLESTGIVAQMFRSVIRGFNVLTRKTSFMVAASIDEAVLAIAPLVISDSPSADTSIELKAALVAVREGFRPTRTHARATG